MNPAAALHDLLKAVIAAEAALPTAWSQVLEAEYGSSRFAKRHAEVMHLLGEALRLAWFLPDDRYGRHARYAPVWWKALVMPDNAWINTRSDALIGQSDLDHLANLGDLLDASLRHTAAVPDETRLEDIKADCQEWLDALPGFTSLPPETRRLLEVDLHHVVWLIDNVGKFGSARAAHEAQAATAAAATATDLVTDPVQRAEWLARSQRLIGKVALFTFTTTASLTPALASSAYMLEQVNNNIDQVADIVDGPEAPSEVAPPEKPPAP